MTCSLQVTAVSTRSPIIPSMTRANPEQDTQDAGYLIAFIMLCHSKMKAVVLPVPMWVTVCPGAAMVVVVPVGILSVCALS